MSILGLLNQTLTIQQATALNRYGRETFGSATTIKCRFEKRNKVILLPNGQTQVIDGIIFVPNDTSVNIDDKVTFSSNDYKVLTKDSVIGRGGDINHYELQVVKWQQT